MELIHPREHETISSISFLQRRWYNDAILEGKPWHFNMAIYSLLDFWKVKNNHFNILREIGVTSNTKVLDVGCGLGDLAGYFNPLNYIGVDMFEPVIYNCKLRFPNHTFICNDISNVNFSENSFEWVIYSGIPHDLIDINNKWAENRVAFSYTPPNQYTVWTNNDK